MVDLFLHELAFQWGGAEKVLHSLTQLRPSAPVAVIAGDRALLEERISNRPIEVFFPSIHSNGHARAATPWLAWRLPRKKLDAQRLVVSSYAMARWLPTTEPRLVYCHSPMRQIWHGFQQYTTGRRPEAVALRLLAPWLRLVDVRAGQPGDYLVAPSPRIADLLRNTYGVGVQQVIPPAVERDLFNLNRSTGGDYFIWVGRMVEPVKRLSLLLSAFSHPDAPRLIMVGDGRSRRRLERQAPPQVEFLGWQTQHRLWALVAGAQALLLPSMEDLGLSAAEALALGTPVIVSRDAGIAAWVREGHNGWLVNPSVADIRRAVGDARRSRPDSRQVRASARHFHPDVFRRAMTDALKDLGW